MLTSKCASHHNGVHFSTSQLPKVVRTWCVLYIWLRNVHRATTVCTFSTFQLPKVVQAWCVLCILTFSLRNVLRASTSSPKLRCFVCFYFEMCIAAQWRALFRHLNFQKCSERDVFLFFSPANVLRATTACTFPSLMLGSWLRTRRFSERPTFRPSGAFATFLPFRAPGSSFF